jgi:hypothetical protein
LIEAGKNCDATTATGLFVSGKLDEALPFPWDGPIGDSC